MQSFVTGGILAKTMQRILLAPITVATGGGFHSCARIPMLVLALKSDSAEKQ